MENVPYYDLSVFPLDDDLLLERFIYAAENNFKSIVINFGEFFPWSPDIVKRSKYSYTDKIIEKIVEFANKKKISIIPVLSILLDSDFILSDFRYNHLFDKHSFRSGLNINSCGAAKLVEELSEDLFSLLIYSNYLLLELPDSMISINEKNSASNLFKERLVDYFSNNNKKLIFYSKTNLCTTNNNLTKDNYEESIKNIKIYNGDPFQISISNKRIIIDKLEHNIFYLNSNREFIGSYNIGIFINFLNHKEVPITDGFDEINNFFNSLDAVWNRIRICRVHLSEIFRNTETCFKGKFHRSVFYLDEYYEKLKRNSVLILHIYEIDFQKGVLAKWMYSKMDYIIEQISELHLKQEYIAESGIQ
jgi:hypothetical protein